MSIPWALEGRLCIDTMALIWSGLDAIRQFWMAFWLSVFFGKRSYSGLLHSPTRKWTSPFSRVQWLEHSGITALPWLLLYDLYLGVCNNAYKDYTDWWYIPTSTTKSGKLVTVRFDYGKLGSVLHLAAFLLLLVSIAITHVEADVHHVLLRLRFLFVFLAASC